MIKKYSVEPKSWYCFKTDLGYLIKNNLKDHEYSTAL